MSKLFSTSGLIQMGRSWRIWLKWIFFKIGFVLEVYLEYPKKMCKWDNDYPLAPDKIESKKEMLYNYQLNIANFYNIPIAAAKQLSPYFWKRKGCGSLGKLTILLKVIIEARKAHHLLEFNQSQWLKPYFQSHTQKK